MKTVWILLCCTGWLWGASPMPTLYAEQFVPLYQASERFEQLRESPGMKTAVTEYAHHAEAVREAGLAAEKADADKAQRLTYLKGLRELQREHDKLTGQAKRLLLDTMQQDDYTGFLQIINTEIEAFYRQPSLNDQLVAFYREHRHLGTSKILERRLSREKGVVKQYAQRSAESRFPVSEQKDQPVRRVKQSVKKITLVSSPGCPWCQKAKRLFHAQGVRYTEYSPQSGTGRDLMRRHNATGVPLIIIGDRVIRGYSESTILNALE